MLLVILLIVFAAIFFIAFIGLQRKESLLDIGMPVEFENWVIMILCLGSIIKIIYELVNIKN
jgi:hypothetical protein